MKQMTVITLHQEFARWYVPEQNLFYTTCNCYWSNQIKKYSGNNTIRVPPDSITMMAISHKRGYCTLQLYTIHNIYNHAILHTYGYKTLVLYIIHNMYNHAISHSHGYYTLSYIIHNMLFHTRMDIIH